ncbi:hypothetical protein B0H67DRAFT_682107 [Lasiosphaeris hirsuta]|uniref:tRNA-intron lyase n=1 Tax=Lasiosphaeris hirsuta TaxID=260670 RepID=A0AA40E0U3_9PEZI|nr:hypothetical protein B0H67DRAFT_682107 [Lasiosphaeris hirsuta]
MEEDMAESTTVMMASANEDTITGVEATLPSNASDATITTGPPTTSPTRVPLYKIYALPTPIRTFPLPTFYPSNPISLIHLVIVWLRQVVSPPQPEPSTIHVGVWDPNTRSVHVKDPGSISALWEQGFYGKGSLSRSEPNWMKREIGRRESTQGNTVSEERTEARREERRQAKWERAKTELEAIERQISEEALTQVEPAGDIVSASDAVLPPSGNSPAVAELESPLAEPEATEEVAFESQPPVQQAPEEAIPVMPIKEAVTAQLPVDHPIEVLADFSVKPSVQLVIQPKPPVGPAELLALPNSVTDLIRRPQAHEEPVPQIVEAALFCRPIVHKAPVGPAELLALPNSQADLVATSPQSHEEETHEEETLIQAKAVPICRPVESKSPIGPAELLALPNCLVELMSGSLLVKGEPKDFEAVPSQFQEAAHTLPTAKQPTAATNGHAGSKLVNGHAQPNGLVNGYATGASACVHREVEDNDASISETKPPVTNGACNGITSSILSDPASGAPETRPIQGEGPQLLKRRQSVLGEEAQPLKRRKSVRFSPRVVSTTFQHFDPPSPSRSTVSPPKASSPASSNGSATTISPPSPMTPPEPVTSLEPVTSPEPETTPDSVSESGPETYAVLKELSNKEHFQLAPEEAFFLSFSVGALSVMDPVTLAPIPTEDLLTLFRAHSYFPPRTVDSSVESLQPHDPFLVNYAVYHHFRSLGWVPRHGMKFGVDFILYQRGPVFDHSEFGVMVMPSFSDAQWTEHEHQAPRKSWSWLMGVNRVLAHVLKGLVLVYVDIPPPPVFDDAMKQGGIAVALKLYNIREVMVRRFSANRNR